MRLEFSRQISENTQIQNFIKNPSSVYGRSDGHDGQSPPRNFANAPNKVVMYLMAHFEYLPG